MAYRTQGSVMTNTNVKVYSDFDLLTIIDGYYYPQTSTGTSYAGNPKSDIEELREQATAIMKLQYDKVDDSGDKCISIENQNLRRKVDIVFAYWYNSDKYEETKDEYYRGVYLYDFPKRSKSNSRDFPFATIHNVNIKGDSTRDGLRKGIRLLKNLRADADIERNYGKKDGEVTALWAEKVIKNFKITNSLEKADIRHDETSQQTTAELINVYRKR